MNVACTEEATGAPAAQSARAASNELTVETYDSWTTIAAFTREWDEFVTAIEGDVYFTADWCRVWWKHYGSGRQLRIFVARSGGKIVGIVPMFRDRVRLGLSVMSLAKLVGSDFTTVVCRLPIRSDMLHPVLDSVLRELTRDDWCDAVALGPLGGNDGACESVRQVCAANGSFKLVREHSASPHTWIPLPDTYASYLASLNKRQRQNLRRDNNLMQRELGVQTDVVRQCELLSEFDRFRELHNAQWRTEGKLGHFGDWPMAEPFNHELVATLAATDRVLLFRYKSADTVLAYQLCFVLGGNCFWRLPARIVGPSWERFGFGRCALVNMIEWLIEHGIHAIEAGGGHYDYKVQLGGKEYAMQSMLLARPRMVGRCRRFARMADLLHLVYYRVWYLRVTPQMRFLRRPLWKLWIRTRV
jgi:CelD/BcsL family acetyltransferase involved in cellulose biosynthesis